MASEERQECAMRSQHGCSLAPRWLCVQCERWVCDLHAVNTYGSMAYCVRCYTRLVANLDIAANYWDDDNDD